MDTNLTVDMSCTRERGMLENKSVVGSKNVTTHVAEAQYVALKATASAEMALTPPEAQCGVATALDSQPMPEECSVRSPVVSMATPVYDGSSLDYSFSDWPPCNQEAARGAREECKMCSQNQRLRDEQSDSQSPILGGDTHVTSFWSVSFSPIELPSDPEDTSVLEHLEVLKEVTEDEPGPEAAAQVEIEDFQDSGESSDASFSEWMQAED